MSDSNILVNLIPAEVEDVSTSISVNCNNVTATGTTSINSSLIFPNDTSDVCPSIGGAIYKIEFSAIGAAASESFKITKISSSFNSAFSFLEGISSTNALIRSKLLDFRLQINEALYNIASSGIADDVRGVPELFLSTAASDSEIDNVDALSHKISNICKFCFIPKEALQLIATKISQSSLSELIGYSGIPFSAFSSYGSGSLSDESLINLLTDFFTIYNINDNDILYPNPGNLELGGFFTIENNCIYVKLPNFSGYNSAGEVSGILTNEHGNRQFFLESILNESIRRIKINYAPVPSIIPIEYEFDNITNGNLVIPISGNVSLLSSAYLSLIDKPNISVSGQDSRGFTSYYSSIEVLTAPSTRFSYYSNGSGTMQLSSSSYLSSFGSYILNSDILSTSGLSALNDNLSIIDIPLSYGQFHKVGISSIHDLIGDKNRAEILLSDGSVSPGIDQKNDDKFFNQKINSKRKIFSSIRHRFCSMQQIPPEPFWIMGEVDKKNSSISFDYNKIKLFSQSKPLKFRLYGFDQANQIFRCYGPNISVQSPQMSISSITPDGYRTSQYSIYPSLAPLRLSISGKNLEYATSIKFYNESTSTGVSVSFSNNNDVTKTSEVISIPFNNGLSEHNIGNAEYVVSLISDVGTESNALPFNVSSEEVDIALLPTDLAISAPILSPTLEFWGSGFKLQESIGNIPLCMNGQDNALINIKSKSQLFTGEYDLFAYIASDDINDILQFELSNRIIQLDNVQTLTSTKNLYASRDVVFQFGTDQFYRVSDKKAIISFPGKYYQRNFSKLSGKTFYIIISSKELSDFSSANYGLIQVGDDNISSIILPPDITSIIAKIPGEQLPIASSQFFISDEFIERSFGLNYNVGQIIAGNSISRLGVIFTGQINNKISYSFSLNDKSIDNLISRRPTALSKEGLVYVEFKNLKTSDVGFFPIKVSATYSDYNITLNSEILYKNITSRELSSDEAATNASGLLSLTKDFGLKSSDWLIATSPANSFAPNNFCSKNISNSIISLNNPASVSVNIDAKMPYDNGEEKVLKVDSFASNTWNDNILRFSKVNNGETELTEYEQIRLNSGASTSDYISYNGISKIFLLGMHKGYTAISFNMPQVISIEYNGATYTKDSEYELITPLPGDIISFKTINCDINAGIKISSIEPIILDRRTNGKFTEIKIKIPDEIVTLLPVDCTDISISNSNADLIRSRRIFGNDVVTALPEYISGLMDGSLNDKIPNITELLNQVLDAPLRFVNQKIDKASIPKELINSFCDLSFHLTSELNISLKGFQMLMVPIQVIFCIIDVICALMNPVKIASAVVRLFECLYDLLLLLPQISVPVMFLQLLLHLLKLLECLISKVVTTLFIINEIIVALQVAYDNKNYASILALEDVLNQYLFSIEADLQVLQPVTSILAIFLQLLQLAFRFPCSISASPGSDAACGIDGSILRGFLAGVVSPNGDAIDTTVLVPAAQSYPSESIDSAGSDGTDITNATPGLVIVSKTTNETLEDVITVDDNFRVENEVDFKASYSLSVTKTIKGFRDPRVVKFMFKDRGRTPSFFPEIFAKYVEENQNIDSPIHLVELDNNDLIIATSNGGFGNLISPKDDYNFLTINSDNLSASTKPLSLEFEVPTFDVDENGNPIQTGTEVVTRTFDGIPSLAIMDEQLNLYFIHEDGIIFEQDANGGYYISEITATMVSDIAAPKLKFSKEELDVQDSDTDEVSTLSYFDFPQIYFVDVRQAEDKIEAMCANSSINNFLIDQEDPSSEISTVSDCLDQFTKDVSDAIGSIRSSLQAGSIPLAVDIESLSEKLLNSQLCINDSIDNMCQIVVNTLNTGFKLTEDTDNSALTGYPDLSTPTAIMGDYDSDGPPLTGAREYAAGIGDSITISANSTAVIEITPRDSYDQEIGADLTKNITIDIISDTTGSAYLVPYSNLNENIFAVERVGNAYYARITATKPGIVKIKGKICARTIQAVTYNGVENILQGSESQSDCVPSANTQADEQQLGALTKIDRVLTVFFTSPVGIISDKISDDGAIITNPQVEFTELEN